MKITELGITDIPKAFALCTKFNSESPVLSVYKVSALKGIQTLLNHAADTSKCAFVAKDGDRLVGIILGEVGEFIFNHEKVLQERLLFVEKDYRSKKIGLELLKTFISWGESLNVTDVWLNITSGMKHTRVSKLFKTMGFESIGTQWRRRK
tara:strand:+ start:7099 stop:7551 length:453 start_codon:yes stop_codon:yes gene_type:complete